MTYIYCQSVQSVIFCFPVNRQSVSKFLYSTRKDVLTETLVPAMWTSPCEKKCHKPTFMSHLRNQTTSNRSKDIVFFYSSYLWISIAGFSKKVDVAQWGFIKQLIQIFFLHQNSNLRNICILKNFGGRLRNYF